MPLDKLLFIAFDNGGHKTLAAVFTDLGGILSHYIILDFFVYR